MEAVSVKQPPNGGISHSSNNAAAVHHTAMAAIQAARSGSSLQLPPQRSKEAMDNLFEEDNDIDNESFNDSTYSSESVARKVTDHTIAVAAIGTAHAQVKAKKPILLGRNADNTINIQLPNGKMIVVDGTEFPDDPDRNGAKKEETAGAKEAHAKTLKAPPPQASTSKASVEEIADSIPASASCVFHIFDRRVNLDDFADSASIYSLLRAWVQDDPYRYRPPADIDPPNKIQLHEECGDFPTKTLHHTKTKSAAPARVDVLSQLRSDAPKPSLESLRASLVRKTIGMRRQKAKELRLRDAIALRRLKHRGIHLAKQKGQG
jgi:LIN37